MQRLAPIWLVTLSLLTQTSCLKGDLEVSGEQLRPGNPGKSGKPGKGDTNTPPGCGDGLVAGDETCDGSCPTKCDDGNSCTDDALTGAASSCDAVCTSTDITACINRDSCCPAGCDATNDTDCSSSCGDGVVDADETCDQNCPSACDDGNACTASRLTGSPETCNVQCSTTPITACVDDDGCCPQGCLAATDSDCGAFCGNGVIEGNEVCDGDCPTDCDDGMACTNDRLRGTAAECDARCESSPVTACIGGDGCCPASCNELNDLDCAPECGNDVVETGETCDGACPTCDDGIACTTDTMTGSPATCDVVCSSAPIAQCADGDGCCPAGCDTTNDDDCNAVCGNGVREGGEVCDPIADCPTSCDDSNACTTNRMVGSPQTCDAVCFFDPVTACNDGDGCCPNGCNANTDDDCSAMCGNAITESGETCDPMSSCPADAAACDDGDACTGDVFSGDAAQCTALCTFNDVTACIGGDGCCPSNCRRQNDSDCAATCGNGVLEEDETCDPIADCPTDCDDQDACTTDTITGSAASCTAVCQNSAITMCIDGDGCCPSACDATNDDDCSASCGNGVLESGETCDPVADCPTSCDDADACTADTLNGSASNCTATCDHTDITMCNDGDGCCPTGCSSTTDNDCASVCGNGVLEAGETCDPIADCPTGVGDCDDLDACTTNTFSGSAAACDAQCAYVDITACSNGDGCCPNGCTPGNDDDCSSVIDCTNPASWPSDWSTLEIAIYNETNNRRTSPQTCRGTPYAAAPALTLDSRLRQAARCHAYDMASNNFFSHTGTGGTTVGGRVNATGYNWTRIGENIAAGNSDPVAIVDQWMNSTAGHCEAIMNPNYDDIGIGYAFDADSTYKHYSVQVFGRE